MNLVMESRYVGNDVCERGDGWKEVEKEEKFAGRGGRFELELSANDANISILSRNSLQPIIAKPYLVCIIQPLWKCCVFSTGKKRYRLQTLRFPEGLYYAD